MRRSTAIVTTFILTCILCAAAPIVFAQTAGGTRGAPGRPPTSGEGGLRIGRGGPTTQPGSHESSTKDEKDRIAGKFPPPKEKKGGEAEQRAAAGTSVYVDVTVLEPERQAIALARDSFRVTIDGGPRRVISAHYVFRGPKAADAGRTIRVGEGVIAHADEARTIAVVVDETTFPAGAERTLAPDLERLLDLVGPVDRAGVLTLPHPAALTYAAARTDLLAGIRQVAGRQAAQADGPILSLDALARVLQGLIKVPGPKSILLFAAPTASSTRPVSQARDPVAAHLTAVLDAAASSRTVVHVVSSRHPRADVALPPYLQRVATSTGGTITRLNGEPNDLATLAGALLGGYVLEVEGRTTDRDGTPHALAVTTTAKGVRVFAPTRWMPRADPLPAPVVTATRAGR